MPNSFLTATLSNYKMFEKCYNISKRPTYKIGVF
jgi:hypothetical protein